MNILYICHVESDYGGAFLFNGLCQLVGGENIYDLPVKQSYHGTTHHYYLPGNEQEGHTSPLPWMDTWPCNWEYVERRSKEIDPEGTCAGPAFFPGYDDSEIEEEARTKIKDGFFDLVVIEALRAQACKYYRKLKDDIKAAGLPVVIHDGEDYMELMHDLLNEFSPDLILKREFNREWPADLQVAGAPVIPFPFSFPYPHHTPTFGKFNSMVNAKFRLTKSHDVTFLCGGSWPDRMEVGKALLEADGINGYIGVDALNQSDFITKKEPLLPYMDYLVQMAKSKCAVSERGFGWDTCRYWEIPFCTLMVCREPGITLPNPFAHETHCFSYSTASGCVDQVRRVLDMPQADREDMTQKGWDHALLYHTNKRRAQTVLDKLGLEVPSSSSSDSDDEGGREG